MSLPVLEARVANRGKDVRFTVSERHQKAGGGVGAGGGEGRGRGDSNLYMNSLCVYVSVE